jgi:hypothetical protein
LSITEETSKPEKAGKEEERIGIVSRRRKALPPPSIYVGGVSRADVGREAKKSEAGGCDISKERKSRIRF